MSQKIIKRVLAFVLSAAMVLGSMSIGLAASVAKVKVGTPAPAVVGGDVIVPITLEDNTASINGLQFKVTYDANVLEYKSTTPADLLQNGVVDVYDTTTGSVGVAYVTVTNPITTSAKLCDVAFTAKAATTGTVVAISDIKALDANVSSLAVDGEACEVVVNEPVQYDYVITGTAAAAKQGETVTVDFNVTDNKLADVKGAHLFVTYDAAVLTAAEGNVAAGELLNEAVTDVNVNEAGKIGIMSVKTEDILKGDGKLLSVTFDVKDDAAVGTYPVDLTVVKLLNDKTEVIDANGNITGGSVAITEKDPIVPALDYTITGSQVSAKQGEQATVVFTVSDNTLTGVNGVDFEISYNADAFTVAETDVTRGALLAGATVDVSVEESGKVGVMSVSTNDIVSGNGTLVSVTFTVKSDAAIADYPIDLAVVKLLDGNVQIMDKQGNVIAGKVTVTAADQPVDPLPAYKEEAKAAIDAARAAYADADYDDAGVAALNQAVTEAKAAIDAAADTAGVDAAKQAGLDALAAVETKAQKAQKEADKFKADNQAILAKTIDNVAIADEPAVEAALADYVALSDAAKALVTTEKGLLDSLQAKIAELKAEAAIQEEANAWKAANADILAKTVDNVAVTDKAAVEAALAAYEGLSDAAKALVSNEQQLLDDLNTAIAAQEALAAAKEAAKANLDLARTLYDDTALTDDQKTALNQIVANGKAAIDAAKTEPAVQEALNNALAALNAAVQVDMDKAKADAILRIQNARAAWNDKGLSKEDIAKLDQMVNAAIERINQTEDLTALVNATQAEVGAIESFEPTPVKPVYIPGGSGGSPSTDNPDEPSVVVPAADASARVYRNIVTGQKGQITVPSDEGVTVQFTSSQPTIATVSQSGLIETLKAGKTNISVYVTKGNITTKTTVRLTVKDKAKVPAEVRDLGNVTIASTGTPVTTITKSMKVNTTSSFKIVKEGNATVSYSVKNSKVATVTSAGKITAKKAGTTKVIAAVTVNGQVQKYRVTVTVIK